MVRDGMVYRYRSGDGLQGQEGAFTACSFWYVECLARAGRVDQAHLEFEQLLRYANPLGLYAEEFDRQGCHSGNTPGAVAPGADQRGQLPGPQARRPAHPLAAVNALAQDA